MQKLKLLTLKQAARDSGISYKLLSEATKAGRIRTIVLSRRPLISAEALASFIEEANKLLVTSR